MTTNDHASRLAELEADNARLRRLLDKSDAPGELRHRLNSTLAMLRVIIQKSAETKRDLPDYVAHLEDRLEAIARAQHAADARGGVDLQGLLSEELLYYNILDGDQLSLQGPLVLLEPRAGQVLALAIHELAVNAIEHGPFASGTRRALRALERGRCVGGGTSAHDRLGRGRPDQDGRAGVSGFRDRGPDPHARL